MQISITETVSVCQNNKEETNCTDIYKNYCDYINNLACFTSFWARVFLQCSSMLNVHFWKEPCLHKYSVEIHLIAFSHQHHRNFPLPPKKKNTHSHLRSSQNSEYLIYTAVQAWNHTLVAFPATWIWQVISMHK